jgi:hypothetical protein
MRKKLLILLAPLALTGLFAVPSTQAAVPPIKAFPKVFINGIKATSTRRPAIAFGNITLHNGTLGNLTCNNVVTAQTYNEATEGTEKGFQNTIGYTTFECKAENTCKVKNTRGEEVEGIYATAFAPPPAGTEAHESGVSSLPWTGEAIEREEGKKQILTHKVRVWIVLPPSTVGKGLGCLGAEIEFLDEEGTTEKEAGYELAPLSVNGSKNGLKPSHGEFKGEEGLTEKGFPQTGRLFSPTVNGDGFTTAPKLVAAGLNGAWELTTLE